MRFRDWINETILPKKPDKVTSKRLIRNKSTNNARPINEFRFTTKLGNVVKVQFDERHPNEYEVIFYVNDTLEDNASAKSDNSRDPEILSGVMHVIDKAAERLNAKKITFSAFSGVGDNKIVTNIDIKPYKAKADYELDNFINILKSHPIKMIEPTDYVKNLAKKFNAPTPVAKPDLDTPAFINLANQVKENPETINAFLDKFLQIEWKKFGMSFPNMLKALKDLEVAVHSHRPGGAAFTRNRRQGIYNRLLSQFADKWNVITSGSHYTLMRK